MQRTPGAERELIGGGRIQPVDARHSTLREQCECCKRNSGAGFKVGPRFGKRLGGSAGRKANPARILHCALTAITRPFSEYWLEAAASPQRPLTMDEREEMSWLLASELQQIC